MDKTKRAREEVIAAIKGSGGIKTTIADRLRITRQTVDAYLRRWATVRHAYDEECQKPLDLAESIIIQNLQLQYEKQRGDDGEIVNTKDARWLLTMKGADRGYAPKQQVQHSGEGDKGEVLVRFVGNVKPEEL